MDIEAEFSMIVYPCSMFETEVDLIIAKATGKDAVAVMACSSGFVGIKDILEDFPGKLIPMMKTCGTHVFKLVKDKKDEYCIVDDKSARVIKIREMHK